MPQTAAAGRPSSNGHVTEPEVAPGTRSSLLGRAVRELAAQSQRRIQRADLDERDPDFIREFYGTSRW